MESKNIKNKETEALRDTLALAKLIMSDEKL